MSSVAAKVRWVAAAGRRRPRVQGPGPRPSPCGPAAAAGRSPAAGEARLEQGSVPVLWVPVLSGSRGHGRCLARHPRVRGQSRRRCSRGLLPLSRDPPAWKPGPTASAPSRSVLSRHPGRPGGLGLPTALSWFRALCPTAQNCLVPVLLAWSIGDPRKRIRGLVTLKFTKLPQPSSVPFAWKDGSDPSATLRRASRYPGHGLSRCPSTALEPAESSLLLRKMGRNKLFSCVT